jgi:hypothetical protein
MDRVTIEIDRKWRKTVRSPLYGIVAATQGVSVAFALLFQYWSGKGRFLHGAGWIAIPSCFAVILPVGLFYMRLGGAVAGELRTTGTPV